MQVAPAAHQLRQSTPLARSPGAMRAAGGLAGATRRFRSGRLHPNASPMRRSSVGGNSSWRGSGLRGRLRVSCELEGEAGLDMSELYRKISSAREREIVADRLCSLNWKEVRSLHAEPASAAAWRP
eukprot:scaffold4659_cov352-Prasinococcus_capsulatus_cf.AAC.11